MAERQSIPDLVADLDGGQMTKYLRMIGRLSPEQAAAVAQRLGLELARLGKTRDDTKAMPENYLGAIVVDTPALLRWASMVRRDHTRATRQLVVLDATAFAQAGDATVAGTALV